MGKYPIDDYVAMKNVQVSNQFELQLLENGKNGV